MKPLLREKKYGPAVELCVNEIDLVISGKKSEISSKYESEFEIGNYIFLIAFISMLTFVGVIGWKEERRLTALTRGSEQLKKLMKEIDEMKENEIYESRSCPICLEDFPETTQSSNSENSTTLSSAEDLGQSEQSNLLDKQSEIRPMALHCGHVYCFKCLDHHLRSPEGTKCPICRQPVDVNQPPREPTSNRPNNFPGTGSFGGGGASTDPTSCQSTMRDTYTTTNTSRPSFHPHLPAIRFRIGRMRTMYPDFMTEEATRNMYHSLDSPNDPLGEFQRVATERSIEAQRIVSDARARAAAARSGSKGSSRRSFGGGRSSGGGGGRW